MLSYAEFQIPNDSPFSLRNIPFGVFSNGPDSSPRCCSRLGDFILDLSRASSVLFSDDLFDASVFSKPSLNAFASTGRQAVRSLRSRIAEAYRFPSEDALSCLIPVAEAHMHLPFIVGNYTDFLCSQAHARNMSRIAFGEERLMPGFLRHPIAYHGRASSVVVSGTEVVRPIGTALDVNSGEMKFGPTESLDFEVEMGYFVAHKSHLGSRVDSREASDYIFGAVIVNDWSARDHQGIEMGALGPFNAKNFATSVSPWVVTLDAMEPFQTPAPEPGEQLAPHLRAITENGSGNMNVGSWYDISLRVTINDEVVSRPNLRDMNYSPEQMIAHHTLAGAPLAVGDLMATGTVSSSGGNFGCLAEKTEGGRKPFATRSGEKTFLDDGDVVTISAWAGEEGSGVGWAECVGRVCKAIPLGH